MIDLLIDLLIDLGTYEQKNSKKSNGKQTANGRSSVKYEVDAQGLVPLPAKICFRCGKSCRMAPLIACDYCPLLFHQVSNFLPLYYICLNGVRIA